MIFGGPNTQEMTSLAKALSDPAAEGGHCNARRNPATGPAVGRVGATLELSDAGVKTVEITVRVRLATMADLILAVKRTLLFFVGVDPCCVGNMPFYKQAYKGNYNWDNKIFSNSTSFNGETNLKLF